MLLQFVFDHNLACHIVESFVIISSEDIFMLSSWLKQYFNIINVITKDKNGLHPNFDILVPVFKFSKEMFSFYFWFYVYHVSPLTVTICFDIKQLIVIKCWWEKKM